MGQRGPKGHRDGRCVNALGSVWFHGEGCHLSLCIDNASRVCWYRGLDKLTSWLSLRSISLPIPIKYVMKLAHTIIAVSALLLCSPVLLAEDTFRPLDTRTRCIVLFRKCLVLIDKQDVEGVFEHIADGQASGFKLYPDLDSVSPDLKEELEDVNRFLTKNFRSASLVNQSFNELQFADLVTAEELVSVTKASVTKAFGDGKAEAKLHSIKIKIKVPDSDRHEIGKLRFVQLADKIYWVPFGW
ncbi:hypothetical protein SV7mr_26490 [Stieleria bergensis]|uniref:Uncharacterized protein n=2 Tax=Stieleria bergensis TaxID=2528025 RepID=A0A517SVI1_9BACT|nr:hypothetical protein SV7mr_26490 [Planctomycetes bacterium SV_7m_r]